MAKEKSGGKRPGKKAAKAKPMMGKNMAPGMKMPKGCC